METNKEENGNVLPLATTISKKVDKPKDSFAETIKVNEEKKEKLRKERLEKNKKVLRDYQIK